MNFRKLIFWLHLVAGLIAGVVILIMCVTGAAIAFEKQIIAAAEGPNHRVTPPANTADRLTVDEWLAHSKASNTNAQPTGITMYADPSLAAVVSFGRNSAVYVDPRTGETTPQGAAGTRGFMQIMTDWHRWLGREGKGRTAGKAITGACNTAFLVLALSGIYLWWPRRWSIESLKSIALFRTGLRGKARDWNWHNVIGLWSAPVLVVLTASGMVISYRWAGDLVYRAAGSTPPPPGAGRGGVSASRTTVPPSDTRPLDYEQLFTAVQQHVPEWDQITFRLGTPSRPGGSGTFDRSPKEAAQRPEHTGTSGTNAIPEAQEHALGQRPTRPPAGSAEGGMPAVSASVKERRVWPLFATLQLTLDPYTGAVMKSESYSDQDRGRKVRSWLRFLHTGEALGWMGQLVAALASLGGGVLVWTGLALSCRRFFGRKPVTRS